MDTRVLPASTEYVQEAAKEFLRDTPVVVPTETVYGLAAPITNVGAVKNIYVIKGRPQDNPLIVHIASYEQLNVLATQLPGYAKYLLDAFWPGPLTIVVKATRDIEHVTSQEGTIAIRMPAHPFITALINAHGPLAAPSANLSGKPSPTTAEHCLADLNGLVGVVFDGGEVMHGVESTVLDISEEQPTILRPGVITQDMIEDVIKRPCRVRSESKKSPGSRYAHYQPEARVIISDEPETEDVQGLGRVLIISKNTPIYPSTHIPLPEEQADIAKHIYAWLRQADNEGYDTVIIQTITDTGIGAAVMDRLRRAAKHS